jgi:hypothetical protein
MDYTTQQIVALFVLSIPIACVAWTITHEEVLKEPREYCRRKSEKSRSLLVRKFFYLFTCEYCFSHYVALGFLALTNYKLLYADWRGYVVAEFALVWISNHYMGIYNRLRLTIKSERVEIETQEEVHQKIAGVVWRKRILKLDESCIRDSKVEIADWTTNLFGPI